MKTDKIYNLKLEALKPNNTNKDIKKISKFKANGDIIDKINEISNYRDRVKDDYLKTTTKNLKVLRNSILHKWSKVVNILLSVDIKLSLQCLKILGDLYLEFDDYETAKNIFFYLKFLSQNLELLDEFMLSYEALGTSYKFLYQYHKAIKCYKKQIEVAWALNNKPNELRGYDNIGIQYFYLANRDKAKYYHDRMLAGKSEKNGNKTSDLLDSVVKRFKDKNFNAFYGDDKYKGPKSNEDLTKKME